MLRRSALFILVSFMLLPFSYSFAEEAPQQTISIFTVERFVVAGSIENIEPVGIVDAFSSATEKVFCFLEARDISEDTSVSFVWYLGDTKKATVDLPIKAGKRWRTYSSKKLGGQKGEWKVELQDVNGTVQRTLTFTVE